MRPFKVIIFDVDSTLIYRLPRPAETLLNFARRKGLPTFPDALQRGERRSYVYYAGGQADEERALLGAAGFKRNFVAALLHAMCRVEDLSRWLDEATIHLQETPRREHCPEHARRVVRSLAETGYRLAAVSNRSENLRPVLMAHGLAPYFVFTLSAGRAGVPKPDPQIFQIALLSLGVAPSATLAIGDSYEADILGAHQLGITGVLLDPLGVYPEAPCQTIKGLEELIPWLVTPYSGRGD